MTRAGTMANLRRPVMFFPTTRSRAADVRRAFEKFERMRDLTEPLDENDLQNLHLWMRVVTEAIDPRDG